MYERTYNSRVLKSDTQLKQKKRFPWKRAIIITVGVLLLVGIVVMIKTPKFQVQKVTVVGTNVVDPSDVAAFALNTLDGHYAWILPKTSIFLVSTDAVTGAVREAFPRFAEVKVDRDGVNSLRVTVVEYPGVYLWCDDECAFMDETGTVFANAPYFSGSAYLKIYIGTREQYPFHPITREQVALVATLKKQLEEIDIVPLSMSFESEHKLTVGFIHHTSHASLYVDPSEDVQTTLQTLYSALRTDTVAKLYHDPSKTLQYLDVRFANKLIYKFL